MKRILYLVLSVLLFASLAACGGNGDTIPENPSAPDSSQSSGEDEGYTVPEYLCLEVWKEINLGYTTLYFYEDGTGLIDNGYVSADTVWMVDEDWTVTVQYDYGGVKTAVFYLAEKDGFWCLESDSGTALYVHKSYSEAAKEHFSPN